MCSVNGEPVVLEVEYCSSESEAHPVTHLLESDATIWRASSAVATIHLSLNPPSAISAVVISNAGCAELGIVAMGRGSAAGSYLGSAAPRHDFRSRGDAVQLPVDGRVQAVCGVAYSMLFALVGWLVGV